MDKYVLHLNFHAYIWMMDIVLGYPWMDLVGTVNINVQKKLLKLWYKKKKITLQDISLTKQEGLKGSLEEVLALKLIAVPTIINDSKEPHVEESKKEEPIAKVVVYRHPHHPEKQQSSRQGHEHQQTYYGSTWNQKGNQYGGTWRTKRNAWRYQVAQ
jgi:hypothetical protein